MNKKEILDHDWICVDEVKQLRPERERLPPPTKPPKREVPPLQPMVPRLPVTRPAPSVQEATAEFFAQTEMPLASDVKVLAHKGRVWIVQYVPRWQRDPVVAIVRGWRGSDYLRALRKFCELCVRYEEAARVGSPMMWFLHRRMRRKGKQLVAIVKRLPLTLAEKRFYELHVLEFLAIGMRMVQRRR